MTTKPWWAENPYAGVYRNRNSNVYLNVFLLACYIGVGIYEYQRGVWPMAILYAVLAVAAVVLLILSLRHSRRVKADYEEWEQQNSGF